MGRTVRWVRKQLAYYLETAREQLDENRDESRQLVIERLHQIVRQHMDRIDDPRSAKIVLEATKLEAEVLGLHEQPVRDQTAREIIRALAEQFQMFRRLEPAPRSTPPALDDPDVIDVGSEPAAALDPAEEVESE